MKQNKSTEIISLAIILIFLTIIQLLFACAHSLGFGPSVDILWGFPQATALMNNQSYISEYELNVLGLKLPIATGAYQGGVKPYIAALWMKVIGFSYTKILILNIALSTIALICIFWAMHTSLYAGTIALLLISFFNVHFILASFLDYGPFLLQMIFISLSLGCSLRSITTKEIKFNYISFFFLGLAFNEKVTGLPAVLAITISQLFLIYKLHTFRFETFKKFTFSIMIFSLGALPYSIYFLHHGYKIIQDTAYGSNELKINFLESLKFVFLSLLETFNSTYFSLTENWQNIPEVNHTLNNLTLLSIAILLIFIFISVTSKIQITNTSASRIFFLTSVAIMMFSIQALIPGLHRPWHIFIFYPVIGALLSACIEFLQNNKTSKILLTICISILTIKQIATLDSAYSNLLIQQGKDIYSPGIKIFARKLKDLPPGRMAALTYSISDPVYVLTGGSTRVDNLTWWSKEAVQGLITNDANIKYFILRKSNSESSKTDPTLQGHNALVENLPSLQTVFSVKDKSNTEFILLQRIETLSNKALQN